MNEIQEVKEGRLKGLRVGDKVWDVLCGYGVVVEILTRIEVGFGTLGVQGYYSKNYTLEGYYRDYHLTPVLYFDKPPIIEPPRPKRKVVKTVEHWINLYSDGSISRNFPTKCEASNNVSEKYKDTAVQVHLTGTYEVEE